MKDGKTPKTIVSRIVARTVFVVSGALALVAGRDFFFPGRILDFVPRDDIYLEWTGAFLHSPPEGSPEAEENGLSSALYISEKFLSQLMALNLLIMCIYKFVAACLIRYGSDGSGMPKARMIWKAQTIGNGLILFLLRLFTPAAGSASLDLRWHLMALAYEAFVLGKCPSSVVGVLFYTWLPSKSHLFVFFPQKWLQVSTDFCRLASELISVHNTVILCVDNR